jgi:hypothetical protein
LKRAFGVLACVGIAVSLTACKVEKKTDLVRRVESYGSPDLANTSTDAMKKWFSNHPKVIAEILPTCQQIQKGAAASWNDSTEGRMCHAASVANGFGDLNVYPVN